MSQNQPPRRPPRDREERLRMYENEQQERKPRRNAPKTRKRGILSTVLSILLVAVLAVAVCIGVLGYKLFSSYEYDDTNDSAIADTVGEDGIMTVALFGVDTRSWSDTSRSDAIMVMSVDPQRGKIKLTSLMRDSYVEVPGHGHTKLCHAYAYGGEQRSDDERGEGLVFPVSVVVVAVCGFVAQLDEDDDDGVGGEVAERVYGVSHHCSRQACDARGEFHGDEEEVDKRPEPCDAADVVDAAVG